jgi:Ca2+-binding RTX toxin-like protein
MSTVMVPSSDGTIITYSDVFNTPQNLPLALAIANALTAALDGGALNAQTYTPPTTPAAVAGDVNELVVPTPLREGTVVTPSGYSFVADSTGGGVFTVVGAQNFIGGNGDLTVWDTVGAASVGGGVSSIAAGDGNDLFGLIPGSVYTVAGGNGNDTYFANGSGAIADGTGNNLIFVGSSVGSGNLVFSYGQDTISVGDGANTVATFGSDQIIFGGTGSLTAFGNTSANETVAGGSGSETIFGGTSGVYFLGSSTSLFVGNTSSNSSIIGSTGQGTVFGGASSNEVIFNNSASLTFVAGTGDSATIVGGSLPGTLFGSAGSAITYFGTSSTAGALYASGTDDSATIVGGSSPSALFGSAGSAITYFATSSTAGALYAAGSGNETLNAAGSTANNSIFGGLDPTSGNSLVGGAGNDTFTAGTGSDTMVGGAGANQFFFTHGQAGGNDFIVGFNLSDLVRFFGYGTAAVQSALTGATVAGGNTTIALSDNTKITFEDISTPKAIAYFST